MSASLFVLRALTRAEFKAIKITLASNPITEITTKSSISVNPFVFSFILVFFIFGDPRTHMSPRGIEPRSQPSEGRALSVELWRRKGAGADQWLTALKISHSSV